MLTSRKWALLDVEFIRTSSSHRCVRKLYILSKNGYTNMEKEFYPCRRYKQLESKYQRSFQYCKQNIHKLTYNPKRFVPLCSQTLTKLNEFIVYNDITLILYKGGTIEKDLCEELDIDCLNIECFEELQKIPSHDPRQEVHCYYNQLIDLISLYMKK